MKMVFSRQEIVKAELDYMQKSGLTEPQLIGLAANALKDVVNNRFDVGHSIAILAGGGNNGNDGRTLFGLLSSTYKCKLFNVGIDSVDGLDEFDVIIDAMLGIGFRGELNASFLQAAIAINQARGYKIAVDIASGLNCDSGVADKNCVRADLTVSFTGIKRGQLLGDGLDVSGEVVVADIGFNASSEVFLLEPNDVVFKARAKNSHKGDYGKVAVIGGNSQMVGAPILSSMAVAALRGGSGLVKLLVANSMAQAYASRALEWTLGYLDDVEGNILFNEGQLENAIAGMDCVAVGMGMGNNPELERILSYLLKKPLKLVLDADALNAIAKNPQVLRGRKAQVIVTPHAMEFCRLANISLKELKDDPISHAKNYAKSLGEGAVLVLKDAATIITDGNKAVINTVGNPVLAKGGSGDVLSGITAAMFCNYDIFTAAYYAPFILGSAAQSAFKQLGNSAIASDIVQFIRV